jgi:NAD(P)-dependent dehydrogenase (short-subunit alcohol dehydrogenase family)
LSVARSRAAATSRPLDGQSALVTGAGRGLGLAAAEALAQSGAEVWLLARTEADLEAAAKRIRDAGGRANPLPCDVTDAAALNRAIAGLPGLDIMVNNAGTNIPEPFVEVSEAHLDRLLDLNVRAAFLAAQAAVRKMLEAPDRASRGGAVINMSSQMGHIGAAGRTVYCLTKHAIEGLTKALAVELAPKGIRVNSVAPTFVATPMTAPMFERKEFRDWVHARIPLGRLGRPEDVAAAILFLASPSAAMVTGTSLLVDGGWTAQ